MSDVNTRQELINLIGYYIPPEIFNNANSVVIDNILIHRYQTLGDYGLKYTNYDQNYTYGIKTIEGKIQTLDGFQAML